jgi:hypothetical protein
MDHTLSDFITDALDKAASIIVPGKGRKLQLVTGLLQAPAHGTSTRCLADALAVAQSKHSPVAL